LNRTKDERGQVLSSLVAVLAVVAIVGGLLVLFGTRGNDSAADAKPADQTSAPKPSTTPTSAPSSAPTSAPSSEPVETTPPPSAPAETPSEKPSTPVETPVVPPSKPVTIPPSERPAVEVYNNTARKGLAEDVAIRARQSGWIVAGRDNWHGKIATSSAYYPPGMLAEANQLAKDLGLHSSKQALPNMKKDRLTVILTSEYSG
jgi:pyruvate/2-oxoglutarate dehydrogenase complex dihydrolipoamide acyltransferase (E2) component